MAQFALKKLTQNILLIAFATTLFSCAQGKVDPFDRQTGATKEEIKNTFFGNKSNKNKSSKDSSANSGSSIPKLGSIPRSSRMIALPAPQKASAQRLISFSVSDQIPLKDVLIELAKSAKLDLDLDPKIDGGVIVNAKNRPLTEILDRICEMGNLRYTLVNNRLHVEKDAPFSKNYLADFLAEGDLWSQTESNITSLLSNSNISSSSSGSLLSSGLSVSLNKSANIITVFASQKGHQKVANYLEQVRKNSSAQVLIEAKVVEVTLNDNFKTGIDWTWTGNNGRSVTNSSAIDDAKPPITIVLGSNSLFGGSINATISALEEFGTVKAIASPRINALNNQKAVLNFTSKLIYFTSDISSNSVTSNGTNNTQNTITSIMHEEPTGTELTITPSIDLATNEITLAVQPKITIQSSTVNQNLEIPVGTDGDTKPITNQIPIINTRELKTVAKIQSGNILVVGGLMAESTNNTDKGIPFLGRIPILGYLFKSVSKSSSVTETVIFVKATIVGSGSGVSKYDRDIHDKFTSSSRPFLNP